MTRLNILCCCIFLCSGIYAQTETKAAYTHADTVRGSISPERSWWNVLKYDLTVKPDFDTRTISGTTIIQFSVLKAGKVMQIDLQNPLEIDSIQIGNTIKKNRSIKELFSYTNYNKPFKKVFNSYFLDVAGRLTGKIAALKIYYHGKPKSAANPPWDGGWIWKKDKNGNPWMSVACQGTGASIWYPCKDHQSDEPDSGAILRIIVPENLSGIGNGVLKEKKTVSPGLTSYTWEVKNPINNYCIVPYIGKYVNFNEVYKGEKGDLNMNYWVLDYNLEKAKKQFADAPRMMKALEYWFGPYPFYKDGYKLVESPHLGMEHQSAIAYGNGYINGYRGTDLSNSGWGLKWDFIIVHESGHEWFANNITTNDLADMWVHEGFTNYCETLFTEYYYGKQAGTEYVTGIRKNIENKNPIIGDYGVNKETGIDVYYKASNMIHTIRQVINNDSLFRKILRGLNATFYHQTVNSKQIEAYISATAKFDFSKIFNQYLRTIQIPVLEYKINQNNIEYRYANCLQDFNLPLKINCNGVQWITPAAQWQSLPIPAAGKNNFTVDPNFYIFTKKLD